MLLFGGFCWCMESGSVGFDRFLIRSERANLSLSEANMSYVIWTDS